MLIKYYLNRQYSKNDTFVSVYVTGSPRYTLRHWRQCTLHFHQTLVLAPIMAKIAFLLRPLCWLSLSTQVASFCIVKLKNDALMSWNGAECWLRYIRTNIHAAGCACWPTSRKPQCPRDDTSSVSWTCPCQISHFPLSKSISRSTTNFPTHSSANFILGLTCAPFVISDGRCIRKTISCPYNHQ